MDFSVLNIWFVTWMMNYTKVVFGVKSKNCKRMRSYNSHENLRIFCNVKSIFGKFGVSENSLLAISKTLICYFGGMPGPLKTAKMLNTVKIDFTENLSCRKILTFIHTYTQRSQIWHTMAIFFFNFYFGMVKGKINSWQLVYIARFYLKEMKCWCGLGRWGYY